MLQIQFPSSTVTSLLSKGLVSPKKNESQMTAINHFQQLDDEVHMYIFSFLFGTELAQCEAVSRSWSGLAEVQ